MSSTYTAEIVMEAGGKRSVAYSTEFTPPDPMHGDNPRAWFPAAMDALQAKFHIGRRPYSATMGDPDALIFALWDPSVAAAMFLRITPKPTPLSTPEFQALGGIIPFPSP